jgi:hypothetical protein
MLATCQLDNIHQPNLTDITAATAHIPDSASATALAQQLLHS